MPKLTKSSTGRLTLLEAYLNNDLSPIYEDALRRPEHYSKEHRALLLDLQTGKQELSAVDYRDSNDLFLTFHRDTEAAKASEAAIESARKWVRALEEIEDPFDRRHFKPPVFEDEVPAGLEPGDKVII